MIAITLAALALAATKLSLQAPLDLLERDPGRVVDVAIRRRRRRLPIALGLLRSSPVSRRSLKGRAAEG